MSVSKQMHNAKWTSSDKYKKNYERIFNKTKKDNNKNYENINSNFNLVKR